MKIAFVHSHPIKVKSDGVRSQALTWKEGLESLGHQVVLVNMWDKNDWESFDIVQFFSFSEYMADLVHYLSGIGVKVSIAPIFDPNNSISILKFYAHWGSLKLRLSNSYYQFRNVRNLINICLVRSEFEKKYIIACFGIPEQKCKVVPLSYRIEPNNTDMQRKDFCLHISLLADKRKNVKRLIEAAKKYNFRLVLAGMLRNESEQKLLNDWIGNAQNIEYKGFLSDRQMVELYSQARVFALPSLNEGVGIVALEAAAMGCDVVLTSLGGPKEYYSDLAKVVNPYRVDEIGCAITDFLQGDTFQPRLKEIVKERYSKATIAKRLEAVYMIISNE